MSNVVCFRTDLIWLYKHFKKFSPTNLFGVASDQTPHYFDKSREFRKQNPDSKVGSLGKMQGLNTGVTLLDLQRIRSSKVYRNLTQIDEMIKLEKKYNIKGTVGDQVCSIVVEKIRLNIIFYFSTGLVDTSELGDGGSFLFTSL